MNEFVSIKKIIRLFTITLLALWAAQCLFSAQHSARVMSDTREVMLMQSLYNQGFKVRQMLRMFYMGHGRLPEEAEHQELECAHPFARCPFRHWQGAFYVREGQMWLAIEPQVSEEGLDFQCQVSHRFEGQSPWRPPFDCALDDTGLPFSWPLPEAEG